MQEIEINDKQYLLFNLDGTLTDSMVGITKPVQYALRHYGIEGLDLKKLCPFIGPPLEDSSMEYYGFSSEKVAEATSIYREYFSKTGPHENMGYLDTRDLLATLKAVGKHLYVATSKPELLSKQILEHFCLVEYSDFISGANMNETRVRKGDVTRYVLEENQITELDKVVMIGDRGHDIIGAKENSIDSIGVLHGYGGREEPSVAGADWIVNTVKELGSLLNVLVESRR